MASGNFPDGPRCQMRNLRAGFYRERTHGLVPKGGHTAPQWTRAFKNRWPQHGIAWAVRAAREPIGGVETFFAGEVRAMAPV